MWRLSAPSGCIPHSLEKHNTQSLSTLLCKSQHTHNMAKFLYTKSAADSASAAFVRTNIIMAKNVGKAAGDTEMSQK